MIGSIVSHRCEYEPFEPARITNFEPVMDAPWARLDSISFCRKPSDKGRSKTVAKAIKYRNKDVTQAAKTGKKGAQTRRMPDGAA